MTAPPAAINVRLRPFVPTSDLPLVAGWLDCPHVSRWWGDAERALSELQSRDPQTVALIALRSHPVGLLCWQTPTRSELKEAGLTDLPAEIVDVDIMLGDQSAMGLGVGPEALRQLFKRLRNAGVSLVGMATSAANHRALRAFSKAGLQPYRDFEEHGEVYRYFTRSLNAA